MDFGGQAVAEVVRRFADMGVPLLHPEDDLGIKDSGLRKALRCS